jgi:hypothetical protein
MRSVWGHEISVLLASLPAIRRSLRFQQSLVISQLCRMERAIWGLIRLFLSRDDHFDVVRLAWWIVTAVVFGFCNLVFTWWISRMITDVLCYRTY